MCDEFIFPPPHSSFRRGRELGEFSALHSTPFSRVSSSAASKTFFAVMSISSTFFYKFDEWTCQEKQIPKPSFLHSLKKIDKIYF